MSLAMWVLSLMMFLQPVAPWRESYAETATAIAGASALEPLFAGSDGPRMTAALLVSLAWFESRFDALAMGDHGQSLGLFQISRAHGAPLELFAANVAPFRALKLIRESFRVCRDRPMDERLAWYAAGGAGCSESGVAKSRHRMMLAKRLYERKGEADEQPDRD